MRNITHLLDIPASSKWARMDAASTILLRAAKHIRDRWDCFRWRTADALSNTHMALSYASDIAAANNLLVLSREVLYEESWAHNKDNPAYRPYGQTGHGGKKCFGE
jgi:hypothetical protein